MALRFFGQPAIVSLEDNRPQAIHCRTFYDTALAELLREHPWNFAQSRKRLASLPEAEEWAGEYELAYAYPEACVAVHFLLAPGGERSRRFTLGNIDGRRAILTDIPRAVAGCTLFADDTTAYDPAFTLALARRLACLILKATLKGDSAQAREAEQEYRLALAEAKVSDAREGRPFQDENGWWNGGQDFWEAGMRCNFKDRQW
jgi:hypothetical protein